MPVDALRDVLLRIIRHPMELVSYCIPAIAFVVLADSEQENRFAMLARL
jgi:hypothetical protein